jgi:DNA-binding transcriptional MerR regulator
MKKYSIGQVSKLLDVKPHVIRYWEKEFDFLSPAKNLSGRRVYSDRDMHLLYRLRHLLYVKRYTIQGAKKRIWAEITSASQNSKLPVREIRDRLLELLTRIKDKKHQH